MASLGPMASLGTNSVPLERLGCGGGGREKGRTHLCILSHSFPNFGLARLLKHAGPLLQVFAATVTGLAQRRLLPVPKK